MPFFFKLQEKALTKTRVSFTCIIFMSSDLHPNRMTMCEELFTLSKNTLQLNPLKNFENFFEKKKCQGIAK